MTQATSRAPRPADVPLHWRWPLVALLLAVCAWIVAGLLERAPGAAEAYASVSGPLLVRPLSLLTGAVPFAVGEVAVVAYIAWLGLAALRALVAVSKGRRSPRNALGAGVRRIARDGGIIVVAFYVLYGMSFSRPALETRIGWPEWDGVGADELTALARSAVEAVNEAYLELHGSVDAGEPTAVPADIRAVELAIDEGWVRTAELLSLGTSVGKRHGRAKLPLASAIAARFGIAGVYFPFTAEANVVRGMPALLTFQGMAHEKAHQRGIASESEANFLGFAAGALAPSPLARYAAAVFAERQLMASLASTDRDAWRRLRADLHPGVTRDLDDLAAYFRRHAGVTESLGRAVNDRFLRANRVPGGIRDYSRSARLLVVWARQYGGVIMPARGG